MLLEINYLDDQELLQKLTIELDSDDMDTIENYFYDSLGYYPRSIDISIINP